MKLQNLEIDAISDTHNKHKQIKLPGGDILIHSGDVSGRGQSGEILPFLDWYAEQDYSALILVPGNHDWGFAKEPERYAKECADRKIILLNDSGMEVEGIKIWGSPVQPWFHNWAFNRFRGAEIKKHWDLIPTDTEVLITHGPPSHILDAVPRGYKEIEHVGCVDLYNRIIETKIKLHVFGHIHEGAGYKYDSGRTYVNASSLDGNYVFEKPGYKRIVKLGEDYIVEESQSS